MRLTGRQPSQSRVEAFAPRGWRVCPTCHAADHKLLSVPPSLCAKNRPGIPVVWLVALVDTRCSVVEEEFCRWQRGSLLEFPEQSGVERRSSLYSLKGGREAGGSSREIWSAHDRAQSLDSGVCRSTDPAGLRGLQNPVFGSELHNQFRRLGTASLRARGHNYWRQDPLGGQSGGHFRGWQTGVKRQQKCKAPRSRTVPFRKGEYRIGFCHPRAVTRRGISSNPS